MRKEGNPVWDRDEQLQIIVRLPGSKSRNTQGESQLHDLKNSSNINKCMFSVKKCKSVVVGFFCFLTLLLKSNL